ALKNMRAALQDFVVDGVPTTLQLHRAVLDHPRFIAGDYDTAFLEHAMATGDIALSPSPGQKDPT
ncbi:MAG: hypothetical protein GXP62_09515, partial [Oligoflexia bacterium]|nr:hypothetical protein [Oligoflexia bacterium]